MSRWQYAMLNVVYGSQGTPTVRWFGPDGQAAGEDSSGQTALELLNRFGADGWELIDNQSQRWSDGSMSSYTFKRPVSSPQ
jgi:hypothetical protein